MVKKLWLKRKLKNLQKRKWLKNLMEKNTKDVQVFVTGVSMTGKSELNEHNRTPKENQEQSKGEEICNSREDD